MSDRDKIDRVDRELARVIAEMTSEGCLTFCCQSLENISKCTGLSTDEISRRLTKISVALSMRITKDGTIEPKAVVYRKPRSEKSGVVYRKPRRSRR